MNKPWDFKCPKCGEKVNIYGRYPGTYRCPKCDIILEATIEGYLRRKDYWNDPNYKWR